MVTTPGLVIDRTWSRPVVSCSRRSSRSVSWFCVSSIVAPGQTAMTSMVLMVKEGSSSRPSPRKANVPAKTRNHEVDGERPAVIAQSERFGPIITRTEQPDFLARPQGLDAGGDHDLAGQRPPARRRAAGVNGDLDRAERDLLRRRIDHPDRRLAPWRMSAVPGISIPDAVSMRILPVTVEPSRSPAGGSISPTRTWNVPVAGSARGDTSRTRPWRSLSGRWSA